VRFYDLREDQAGDQALSTRSWLRVSPNGKEFGREIALAGAFDLRTAPVATGLTPGRFLGEYQGLVGVQEGFAVLFAQARPAAQIGPTDGFFSRAATCHGKLATIIGTAASEKLKGRRGPDIISGQGGRDKINGLGGKDTICGDLGNDTLRGGKGKDTLLGQKGKDALKGGGGRDLCKGGKGNDTASKCEVEKSI
jgi:Ca2+-binding RTX toxin-like protein